MAAGLLMTLAATLTTGLAGAFAIGFAFNYSPSVLNSGAPGYYYNGNAKYTFAALSNGSVAVRNSRDPQGTALIYSATAVRAMVSVLRSGDFDYLVG